MFYCISNNPRNASTKGKLELTGKQKWQLLKTKEKVVFYRFLNTFCVFCFFVVFGLNWGKVTINVTNFIYRFEIGQLFSCLEKINAMQNGVLVRVVLIVQFRKEIGFARFQ